VFRTQCNYRIHLADFAKEENAGPKPINISTRSSEFSKKKKKKRKRKEKKGKESKNKAVRNNTP